MNIFLYDKTFEGLLTVIFESFKLNIIPDIIASENNFQASLLDIPHKIETDILKAERVWKGLKVKTNSTACDMVYHTFLSEINGVEMIIYQYLQLAFSSNYDISINYRDECVLQIKQIQRKVLRESHRMFMFVRFQKTSSDIYFAPIQPKHDVIPLIGKHFKNRFRDQVWVIYDIIRNYGLYYDLKTVQEIKLEQIGVNKSSGKIGTSLLEEKEETYHVLWKNYFEAINIKERKNLKVQMQFMPKRFWNYLPEKNTSL